MNTTAGWIIWFTGISGSGKTTLSSALKERLARELKINAILLDGDAVRAFFEGDLGYSRPERIMNVRRIAFTAKMLSECGHMVLVANIAPYYEVRDFLRRKLSLYFQVYCKTTLTTVTARDAKNHYRQYAQGKLQQLVGMDDVYDEPRHPDVMTDSSMQTVEESIEQIWNVLRERKIV